MRLQGDGAIPLVVVDLDVTPEVPFIAEGDVESCDEEVSGTSTTAELPVMQLEGLVSMCRN